MASAAALLVQMEREIMELTQAGVSTSATTPYQTDVTQIKKVRRERRRGTNSL